VSGAAGDLELGPHEPLVRDGDLQLRRLGDDRGVRADGAQRFLDSEAGMLLVGHGGDDDIAGQLELRSLAAGDQRRGDAALHVVGAAAVEAIAVDPRPVRLGHVRHADGVEMAAQQQRPAAAGAAGADEDARPARRLLERLDLEAGGARPPGDERGDLRLAGATGDQLGVDRVDGDQPGQQLDDVLAHSGANDEGQRLWAASRRWSWVRERTPSFAYTRVRAPSIVFSLRNSVAAACLFE
jgi:hypothetical protein